MSELISRPAKRLREVVRRRGLALIALAYTLIGVSYALATPPLEASDEYKHYPVVQHIQTTGRLPVLEPEAPGRWLQEAAQPPLYYLLMAGLTLPIDTGDLPDLHRLNKYAFVGDPNQAGNKNLIIHQPELESFPWQGSVLAIYLIRFVSLGIGLATVLIVARLGTLLAGHRIGLLAAALTAFNPMFLFVHAAVNNDSPAILLGSLGLYLLVRLWREAPDPRRHWRRYVALGVVLGLGLLTKLSLGGLFGPALLSLAWLGRHKRSLPYFLLSSFWLLLPALILPAVWLLRNYRLYGDPTALNVFIAVQDKRETLPGWADWMGEFGTLYRSFWGLFGGVNVAAPEWVYQLLNLMVVLALIGLVLWLRRRRAEWRHALVGSGLWLLFVWPLIVFLLLVRWNLFAASFQGRLLFPAIAALNVLWALGLLKGLPPSLRRRAAIVLIGGMLIIASLLPWLIIRPAYARPEPLTAVPDAAAFGPLSFRLDGEEYLRLVGVEMAPEQRVAPGGEPVAVTLYWQAAQPVPTDLLTAVTLLGRDLAPVAHVNRHPAGGMVPTTLWQPGEVWQDRYLLFPQADASGPTLLRVRAGIYDPERELDLRAVGQDGAAIDLLLIGEAVLTPSATPSLTDNLRVEFDERITLRGYELEPVQPAIGTRVVLTLHWQAEGTPVHDYTVFVHLLDADGQQVAGADSPPVNGDFPTSHWRTGDVIDDAHTLDIPTGLLPGDYQIAVGLYDPQSGLRLPRLDGEGEAAVIAIRIE